MQEDEQNCEARNCSENEFRCNSGRCIPKSWSCDGDVDCPTKEDEPPFCTSQDRKCIDPDHFKCNNGKCIPKRFRCDYDFGKCFSFITFGLEYLSNVCCFKFRLFR